MFKKVNRSAARKKKQLRIRNKISGTAARPRLCVFRSLKNISVQLIDDEAKTTLLSASSNDKELRTQISNGGNKEAAKIVGKVIAERAVAKGITNVVFDRAGYVYTGRVQTLAEAAREAGLDF